MVLCGRCNTWQHGVCFTLLQEDEVPELHICELCSNVSVCLFVHPSVVLSVSL